MSLNYDFVFLAAVRASLAGETPEVRNFRCLLHPLRKRKCVRGTKQIDYCADASAILTAAKLADDRTDERGFRKFRAVLGGIFFSGAARRARRRHPALDAAVRDRLARLRELEAPGAEPSADAPAAVFGELMASVFSEELEGNEARIAREIGSAIGHWIYLADAADDFREDKRRGRFNPFLRMYGEDPTPADRETIRLALAATLSRADRAFELIDRFPCPEVRAFLENVLRIGLPAEIDRLIPEKTPEKTSPKERNPEL